MICLCFFFTWCLPGWRNHFEIFQRFSFASGQTQFTTSWCPSATSSADRYTVPEHAPSKYPVHSSLVTHRFVIHLLFVCVTGIRCSEFPFRPFNRPPQHSTVQVKRGQKRKGHYNQRHHVDHRGRNESQ